MGRINWFKTNPIWVNYLIEFAKRVCLGQLIDFRTIQPNNCWPIQLIDRINWFKTDTIGVD